MRRSSLVGKGGKPIVRDRKGSDLPKAEIKHKTTTASETNDGSIASLKQANPFIIPESNFAPVMRGRPSYKMERGTPGLEIYGGYVMEEFLSDLQGVRGAKIYEEMRKNDSIVGSMLQAAEQLIHTARVIVNPSIKNPDAPESLKAAELVRTALEDTGNTWTDVLSEILTMLPFGYSVCAVWHKQRKGYNRDRFKSSNYNDNQWAWGGISLRGHSSLERWEVDSHERAIGVWQRTKTFGQQYYIPLTHAALFRTKTEKDNPEGASILRNAWRAWYMKKHLEEVEAIGMEREATGVPVLTAPEGVDLWNTKNAAAAGTLTQANEIVRNLRTDRFQGVTLPFGWVLEILTTPGQRAQTSNTIINRWDQRIAVTLLADMLLIGHESVGSFALAQSKVRLFSSALESYAARIAGVFNQELIPRMMLLNGVAQEYWPTMTFGPIETPALETLGDFLKDLKEAGINIDEGIGLYARQVAGLPPPKEGETAVQTFEDKLKQQERQQEMFAKFKQPEAQGGFGGKRTGVPQPGKEKSPAEEDEGKQKREEGKTPQKKGDDVIKRYSLGLEE